MAEKYRFGSYTPKRQPTSVKPALATTSTEESGRVQSGVMENDVMFTVEAYDIVFNNLKGDDVSNLLSEIVNKSYFPFYHWNMFRNVWEETYFYAANIDCSDIHFVKGVATVDQLSFHVTGIYPI